MKNIRSFFVFGALVTLLATLAIAHIIRWRVQMQDEHPVHIRILVRKDGTEVLQRGTLVREMGKNARQYIRWEDVPRVQEGILEITEDARE
jgi:hypothetical protein